MRFSRSILFSLMACRLAFAVGPRCDQADQLLCAKGGNGVFNVANYASLQAALDAAGPNFVVGVPAGSYTMAARLTFQPGESILCPRGPQLNAGQATITFTGASGAVIASATPSADVVNVNIQGCNFNGGSGADTIIDFSRVSYSRLDGTRVTGAKSGAIGIKVSAGAGQAYFNIIEQCKADMTNGTGLTFDNQANANQ